jgi:hypothetical protein
VQDLEVKFCLHLCFVANLICLLKGLTGGLGLSGAAAVAAASELPLSPHGDMPPHPDHLSEGDQGTRPKDIAYINCLCLVHD